MPNRSDRRLLHTIYEQTISRTQQADAVNGQQGEKRTIESKAEKDMYRSKFGETIEKTSETESSQRSPEYNNIETIENSSTLQLHLLRLPLSRCLLLLLPAS
jgi:DNA/RNA endonuclease YhcR with UshA esterase domain